MREFVLILIVGLTATTSIAAPLELPVVAQMPDLPSPVVLRDWKQVARDVDASIYDSSKKGDHFPLFWMDRTRLNTDQDVIAFPAYIGSLVQNESNNAYDAITCYGAVLGATLVGIDKSDQNGSDYVEMLNAYFQKASGIDLYLNHVETRTGDTFWYELFPSLLFYQVYDHYRETPEMAQNFIRTADRWHEAAVELGGPKANFDWTAYSFETKQPTDNRTWKEPDAAAGVAWLEYLAYSHAGNTNYLNAAQWAMEFLERRTENPYYECLLPYGAYVAARMNAERGCTYDTEKLVNWVFDGSSPRKWGICSETWGDKCVAGLTGSVYPSHECVFTMNTYLTAGVVFPLVRYDERFADAFGKWMLNLAVNSRYFYANAWKPEDQTCYGHP